MPARVGARPQPVNIEHLSAGDGERLRAIRLRALRDAPDAFGTTLEEAAAQPPESWDRQLEQLATFVATGGGYDLGLVRGTLHDHFRLGRRSGRPRRVGDVYAQRMNGAGARLWLPIVTGVPVAVAPGSQLMPMLVEVCPRCGGAARIIGFVTQPAVAGRILSPLARRGVDARAGPWAGAPAAPG